jgi:hypothetical protein
LTEANGMPNGSTIGLRRQNLHITVTIKLVLARAGGTETSAKRLK